MNTSLRISNGISVARVLSCFWIMSVNYMAWVLPYYYGKDISKSIIADKSLAHILWFGINIPDTMAISWAASGWSGVVVFTILSGFSLWYSDLIRKRFSLWHYTISRISKIYAPYLIACVVALLVYISVIHATLQPYGVSGLIVGASRFADASYTINSPFWFISLLIMLYLFYPIVPMIYSKIKAWGLTLLLVVTAGIYLYYYFHEGSKYYLTVISPIYPFIPFVAYFVLGIVWCYLVVKLERKHWYYIFGSLCVLGLGGSALLYYRNIPPDFYFLGATAFIGFFSLGCLFPISWNKVLRWLGRGTFAVFLYHYIFVSLISPYFIKLGNSYAVSMVASFVVYLIVFTCIQIVLDKYVVVPVAKLMDGKYEIKS